MILFLKYAVLVLSFLVQTTIVSNLNIFGIVSNLFLVVLLYTASVSDIKNSIWFGTVFGVLTDLMCAKIFGINTALMLLFAIAISFISSRMREKNLIYYLIVTFFFTGLYEYISSIFLVGSSMNVTLGYVFLHKVLPTAAIDTVWMLPVYALFTKVLTKIYVERTE